MTLQTLKIFISIIACAAVFELFLAINHSYPSLYSVSYRAQMPTEALESRLKSNGPSNVVLCGKQLELEHNISRNTSNTAPLEQPICQRANGFVNVVIIGQDDMNHVQTNNHINAVFHAMDYAHDTNTTLAIIENSWASKSLQLLFSHNLFGLSQPRWDINGETHLDFVIVKDEHDVRERLGYKQDNIISKTGDEMYYYHSNENISEIQTRREGALRILWTHPSRTNETSSDMCSAVNFHNRVENGGHLTNYQSFQSPYVVIHSRWMSRDGCLKRLGSLAHRIKNQTGVRIHRKAPCLMEPSYIQSILQSNSLLNTALDKSSPMSVPIYIISDRKNPKIIPKLLEDPIMGPNIRILPTNVSWVGSDMMLGALAEVFIGTPISTLSGNIARARVALGFDPKTNYLFPIANESKEQINGNRWEFAFQNANSLYDTRILNHYVG